MNHPRGTFPERRPYLFVLLLELLVVAVFLLAGTLDHVLQLGGGLRMYALANAILTVAVALLITRLRWWGRVGFRPAGRRQLLWVLPMAVPVLLNAYPGLDPGGPVAVAGFLGLALLVGFVEEAVFRGLMLRTLERLGVGRAVAITTVLFSVTHLMNVMAGESTFQAVLQLAYTAAIGFAFTAYALRAGTIWPLIVVHALIDFVAFLQDATIPVPPVVEITVAVVVTAGFTAYGAWLLTRPSPVSAAAREAVAAAR